MVLDHDATEARPRRWYLVLEFVPKVLDGAGALGLAGLCRARRYVRGVLAF